MIRLPDLVAGAVAVGALVALLAPAEPASLCVNGHPRARSPYVTYAGLPARYGYERDHRLPLCLGGADDASNVWYQPYGDAQIKNAIDRATCEQVCRGETELSRAQRFPAFQPGYWRGDGGDHP